MKNFALNSYNLAKSTKNPGVFLMLFMHLMNCIKNIEIQYCICFISTGLILDAFD